MIDVLTTPEALRPLLDDIIETYRDGFVASQAEADKFRAEQMAEHPSRDGFRLAFARTEGPIAGFGYGYTGRAGQWWTDRMRERLPAELYAAWFEGHFEVVEFAVRPEFQRQGIGSALHDRLLAGLPHERALLSTWRADSPARRLYLRKGWRPLADVDDDSTLMGVQLGKAKPA
jgi:GNAT superfamily N-acetyltransferase